MSGKSRILVVDDDSAFRKVYGKLLRGEGYEVIQADDRPSARAAFEENDVDVVVLDLMLPPDGSVKAGLDQLTEMLNSRPASKIIVASGAGDTKFMVEAVKAGAFDFLTKPIDPDVLLIVVERALTRVRLENRVEDLQDTLSRERPDDTMIGQSPPFEAAVEMAQRVAKSELPVLITGEHGTGKELMARSIHDYSPRQEQPFVAINCGAIPEKLMESTLFGHRKGAFTGAHRDRPGVFKEASGGTLFLDEIGDMPVPMQVKLLRALESGEIQPVGADGPDIVDVRIVSATNRDLDALQESGDFREDLYWRIKGAEIELPPLRERPSDIPLLAQHFLNKSSALSTDGPASESCPKMQDPPCSNMPGPVISGSFAMKCSARPSSSAREPSSAPKTSRCPTRRLGRLTRVRISTTKSDPSKNEKSERPWPNTMVIAQGPQTHSDYRARDYSIR